MSQKIFEIIKGMDLKSIETQMALQCAPFITGLKISNLLIVSKDKERSVMMLLKKSRISFFRMLRTDEKVAILLFRRNQLESYLRRRDVREIFIAEGYEEFHLGYILNFFRIRYQEYINCGGEFPHEMGLLLGYPVEDVKGFMENDGENFLYTGYWKVYGDVDSKVKLFEKFEIAKELLIQLLSNGVGIEYIIDVYNKKDVEPEVV